MAAPGLRPVVFDLLQLSGTDTTRWVYRRRRAALEALFAGHRLTAPWAVPVDHRSGHRLPGSADPCLHLVRPARSALPAVVVLMAVKP
ncbi:hypothetical protein ACFY2J_00030 [Streptomyces collinus]|uniref:hypothetical protein n=1 Tax=Streptomyces collinus TaxID=42684 RepID=UPI0036813AC6